MSVFDDLVGQSHVIRQLSDAIAGHGMTHAWLFTGPPGSGRSVAARAFAAGLQCPTGGCGICAACHLVLSRGHPDVDLVVPEGLHLSIRETRDLVARAARSPSQGRWQITIIEDADRIEERTSNTLLRAIEEPPSRGVFLLCAPSAEDLLPTIRSRCRVVGLRLPTASEITDVLIRRDGVDPALAAFAAQASGGHIGRARRLARDDAARNRRKEVLDLPRQIGSVPACFAAAANLVDAAEEEAAALTAERDAAEVDALAQALGASPGARRPRGTAGAFRELEEAQKSRLTRTRRDALDRALLDLAGFYRDVLVSQLIGARTSVARTCPDVAESVRRIAAASRPEGTLQRLEAILATRRAVEENVAPRLAIESMMLALHGAERT